ncbi:MAG: gfo/Idh/MocA family oxidoreductase [Planctomycetes bacterium]|nr:gfo/Idh/MocA family oxidoreductase [Planctomycetota bacterium]
MAKDKSVCNVALVGTKFMGRAHANAYLKVAKFFNLPVEPVMHTVVGRDPVGTPAFAKRWGWANSSTDWKAVVANDEIDLIDVCTPNNYHEPIAVAALEAGKHVACEKPLAATLEVARSMRDAAAKAKRKGVKTAVWFSYRGCPALALARQLVQEGKIGRIFHVRANYLQGWAGPDTPLVWRFDGKVAGSGAHGDLGAHIIDAARFITGEEVTEVCGAIEKTFIKERVIPEADTGNIKGGKVTGKKKMGKVTVDDAVLFLANLSGGGVASFESTRFAIGNQNANRIEVNGEKGSIRWDFEDANLLWYYNAADDAEVAGWRRIMATDAGKHPFAHAWWPDAHILGYEHGFINCTSAILTDIAGKKPEVPVPDFEDAYQTQRVLEAAVLSAKNRQWIKLSEVK